MSESKMKMDICLRILAELAADTVAMSESFLAAMLGAGDSSCNEGGRHATVCPAIGSPWQRTEQGAKERFEETRVERKVCFGRFAEMKTRIAAIFFAAALSAFGDDGASLRAYPSGFSVALDRAGDLSEALPAKFGNQLAPQPVALQPQDVPRITPIASTDDNKILRQVSVSAGFIDLVNHLAHAKAIDRIKPGFFDQYVQNLARLAGDDFSVQPPSMVDARFWKDDVMNDQASYFNQMIGMMVAINFSHHYLGHFDKYAAKMAGLGNKMIPINDLLTPAEWDVSVKAGATDALNCALATDGVRALFDAIDKMPRRPAWTEVIVPKDTDLKKLNKQLTAYETQFFHGGLKFSLLDKFQFRPAWDKAPLVCLAEETCNGGPAFPAIIQRPMIDIHADKLVRQIQSHVPGVMQGMGHGFSPVIETELDAVGQNPRYN
jgi:hypothetical protein